MKMNTGENINEDGRLFIENMIIKNATKITVKTINEDFILDFNYLPFCAVVGLETNNLYIHEAS